MLVGDENGREGLRGNADPLQPLERVLAAQAGVNQETGLLGRQQRGVPSTGGRKYPTFYDFGSPLDCMITHYNGSIVMKARVFVSYKSTVLDPQGQTIQSALNGLGHKTITAVRQGKFFDIEIQAGTAREQAQKEMDQVARDVLANPVMEDYRVEIID